MTVLIAGLLVFFAVHSLSLYRSGRARLVSGFGEMRFKGLYSLLSLAGFAGIVLGMKNAGFVPLWSPPSWSAIAANLMMPVAFCLLVAAYMPNNFRRVIHNPMLLATLVWSAAHLVSNGDLASLLLFGSFGVFAWVDRLAVNRRESYAVPARRPIAYDLATIGIGLAAFWIVRHFHAPLFGVPVPF